MSFLDRLFGRGGQRQPETSTREGDRAVYYYIRCGKCGEVIRVRINLQADLAQEFEGGGDYPTSYSVTKEIVGKHCFKPIHLEVRFDRGFHEVDKKLEGGTFITRQEYEAAQTPSA